MYFSLSNYLVWLRNRPGACSVLICVLVTVNTSRCTRNRVAKCIDDRKIAPFMIQYWDLTYITYAEPSMAAWNTACTEMNPFLQCVHCLIKEIDMNREMYKFAIFESIFLKRRVSRVPCMLNEGFLHCVFHLFNKHVIVENSRLLSYLQKFKKKLLLVFV